MNAAEKIETPQRKHPSFKSYVPYHLNWKVFGGDTCQLGLRKKEGKPEFQTMKFSELIEFLMKKEVTKFDHFLDTTVSLDGSEYVIKCEGTSALLLPIMLELISKRSDINCTWYFYESDRVKDDFHECYTFFLVSKNKIVHERASISHTATSWLNSDFLSYDDDHIWHGHSNLDKATALWWYQKFFNETEIGQIIKIRDSLTGRGGLTPQSSEVLLLQQIGVESKKTNKLLICILVAIVILIFSR